MKWRVLFILLLILPVVNAAVIQGEIYDLSLNNIKAIVNLNTTPLQVDIGKEYSFNVVPGNYLLSAEKDDLSATELIVVKDEGEYVLDLILFSGIEIEEVPEIQVDVDEGSTSTAAWFVAVGLILFLIILLVLLKKSEKKIIDNTSEHRTASKTDSEITGELDAAVKLVLDFIVSQRQTTQLEIRKNFPSSEAKISLILTQLESEGRIRKIKKGRGNIIIANINV